MAKAPAGGGYAMVHGTAIYLMGPHWRFITAIGSRESARGISALLARLAS